MIIFNDNVINAIVYNSDLLDTILSKKKSDDSTYVDKVFYKKSVDNLKEKFIETFKLSQLDSAVLSSDLDILKT